MTNNTVAIQISSPRPLVGFATDVYIGRKIMQQRSACQDWLGYIMRQRRL
jgi:hypothetical protein